MEATYIGQPGVFETAEEMWTQYCERVNFFYQANGITNEAKRKTIFLAIIRPSVYKLLRSLVSPAKPDEKVYEELVEEMEKHHNSIPSEIVQRYNSTVALGRRASLLLLTCQNYN